MPIFWKLQKTSPLCWSMAVWRADRFTAQSVTIRPLSILLLQSFNQSGRSALLYLYSGTSYSNLQKLSGYRQATAAASLPVRDELMVLCSKDPDLAMEQLKELSDSGLKFDSVLAAEDILAVGAVKYANQTGISIPEGLSIIGYNNSILSRCTTPEITSVDNKVEALCTTTVNTLMKVLEGGNVPAKTTITPELIKRGTTNF